MLIDSNYSSEEGRGETLEVKILKLIRVTPLAFSLYKSMLVCLVRNENSIFKTLVQRHLVLGEPTERFLTARGTSLLVLLVCFLCGWITLARNPENRRSLHQTV